MEEKIKLEPIDEEEESPEIDLSFLQKNEKDYVMECIIDLGNIWVSSANLPENLDIKRDSEYYIKKILELFKEFRIVG